MAQARILAPWAGEGNRSASYHCTSWVLDRAFRFGAEEKEKFAEMMRLYADFCGVRILSYCIMSNHFHILAEVPAAPEGGVSDEWLLEKLAMIHPQELVGTIREQLGSLSGRNAPEEDLKAYDELRQQYSRRMLDLGEFMKTLKQSFSRWFNKKHKRRGTLWEERYSSVLVEEGYAAMVTSAYIDLNPVRAGLVEDPKDYRWSNYGAAVSGNQDARRGLARALELCDQEYRYDGESEVYSGNADIVHYAWRTLAARYRVFIYDVGKAVNDNTQTKATAKPKKSQRKGRSKNEIKPEPQPNGNLSIRELLGTPRRHFVDGAVMGSREFVNGVIKQLNEQKYWPKPRKTGAAKISGKQKEIYTLRHLQKE